MKKGREQSNKGKKTKFQFPKGKKTQAKIGLQFLDTKMPDPQQYERSKKRFKYFGFRFKRSDLL
jgi:hypothetical protein